MKVKCIQFYNENLQRYVKYHSHLLINKEYIVLEIVMRTDKRIFYRLPGDKRNNNKPDLYDARQFEVTSHRIPYNWTVHQLSEGILYVGPLAWCAPNFWKTCYQLDPQALAIYQREAKIIYGEEDGLCARESTKKSLMS